MVTVHCATTSTSSSQKGFNGIHFFQVTGSLTIHTIHQHYRYVCTTNDHDRRPPKHTSAHQHPYKTCVFPAPQDVNNLASAHHLEVCEKQVGRCRLLLRKDYEGDLGPVPRTLAAAEEAKKPCFAAALAP
eukprot:TRINITY_DN8463_c0_g1_i2.p1 TRINITY_DN8463_c0_g1~~TRINITY_DN8463_c0_g1_i2.p1  ORF type:complete len:130 (-),score=7.25 TRINITY_DN8463_c0_g1_i2:419-808(-)